MHHFPTHDGDTDGAVVVDGFVVVDESRPIRQNALVRLGAPVVGDLEPTAVASAAPAGDPNDAAVTEPAMPETTAAQAAIDNNVLRRAALLRLVGLGRSRALR